MPSLLRPFVGQQQGRMQADEMLRQREMQDAEAKRAEEERQARLRQQALAEALTTFNLDEARRRAAMPQAPVRGTPEYLSMLENEERIKAKFAPKPAAGPNGLNPAVISRGLQIKGQYDSDQTVKNAAITADSVGKIRASLKSGTAAGDMAGIFTFMKTLDPASTVREGEYANAQNAAGIPERIRTMYNRAQRGEILSPEQRAGFLAEAEGLARAQRQQLRGTIDRYSQLSTSYGVDPALVVYDPYDVHLGPWQGQQGSTGNIDLRDGAPPQQQSQGQYRPTNPYAPKR